MRDQHEGEGEGVAEGGEGKPKGRRCGAQRSCPTGKWQETGRCAKSEVAHTMGHAMMHMMGHAQEAGHGDACAVIQYFRIDRSQINHV